MIHKHRPHSLLYELPFSICYMTYFVTSGNISERPRGDNIHRPLMVPPCQFTDLMSQIGCFLGFKFPQNKGKDNDAYSVQVAS